jgi:hypothetical protein
MGGARGSLATFKKMPQLFNGAARMPLAANLA